MNFLKKVALSLFFFIPVLSFADDISGPAGVFVSQIQNEGSTVTRRSKLNFIGTGVDCVDNSGQRRIDCTISGGGGGSATPGGSVPQLQYNADGVSLGGISTVNYYASTNTLTIGATTIFQNVSTTTWQNVETITVGDGTLMDFSGINMSVNTEGLKLPQATDCVNSDEEGQICWDTDDDILYVGGSDPTAQFPNRDTLTPGSTLYPDFLYVRSSATITGPLSVRSPPILDSEAVSKAYVDSVATGLSVRSSVVAATTGPLVLSGLQSVDGFSVASENRVLVKNQANGVFNGIYLASATAWIRALDYDETSEVIGGSFVTITTGTQNMNTQWVQVSSEPVVNVSTLTFTQLSQQPAYTAGQGLNLTNFVFSIPNGGVSLTSMVNGVLPASNLPTSVRYTNVQQTISSATVFSSSNTFSGLNNFTSTVSFSNTSTVTFNGLQPGVLQVLAVSSRVVSGLVSLSTQVTGILPSANLPSTVTYTTTSQTISGSKIFSSSQVFNGLLFAGSTFTVSGSTIVINGSTTYWTIPRPASNKIFQINSSGQVTLVDDQTGGGGGSTIYNATSTAGFPLGFSASTSSFNRSVHISTTINLTPTGLPPWGLYVGQGSQTYMPINFVDSLNDGISFAALGGLYYQSGSGVSLVDGSIVVLSAHQTGIKSNLPHIFYSSANMTVNGSHVGSISASTINARIDISTKVSAVSIQTNNQNLPLSMVGVMFSSTGSWTLTNTITQSTVTVSTITGIGTLTIPSNSLKQGNQIRIKVRGGLSSAPTQSLQLILKIGTNTVVDSGVASLGSSGFTNKAFEFDSYTNLLSIGSTGSSWTQGNWRQDGTVATPTIVSLISANTSPVNIDTSISNEIQLSFKWGFASSSNILTITNYTVEIF